MGERWWPHYRAFAARERRIEVHEELRMVCDLLWRVGDDASDAALVRDRERIERLLDLAAPDTETYPDFCAAVALDVAVIQGAAITHARLATADTLQALRHAGQSAADLLDAKGLEPGFDTDRPAGRLLVLERAAQKYALVAIAPTGG